MYIYINIKKNKPTTTRFAANALAKSHRDHEITRIRLPRNGRPGRHNICGERERRKGTTSDKDGVRRDYRASSSPVIGRKKGFALSPDVFTFFCKTYKTHQQGT